MSSYQRSFYLEGGPHAVLLLHGLSGTPAEMRFLAKSLNRGGFSVAVPYIESYGLGSKCTTWPEWLCAVRGHFEALKNKYETVSVSGLCIGSTLALALALEQPNIQALSLLSTTLQYDGWTIPWYHFLLRLAYFTPLRHRYQLKEQEPYGLKNEQLRAKVAKHMATSLESAIGSSFISMPHIYQAHQLAHYVKKNINKIHTPALIIHAVDDDTASPKNADFVYNNIASTCKQKILLEDSYHIITMDNEREIVSYQTELFFNENIEGVTNKLATRPLSRALMRQLRR